MTVPALEVEKLAAMFTAIAGEACKPVQGKGFTKQRTAHQTVTLNCVSDEYGGDTFTLKFARKLPQAERDVLCNDCGAPVRGKSKHAAKRASRY